MSKRKYTHIQRLLPEIQEMLSKGKSHKEVEQHFGLTGDRPVHNLLKQERRRQKKIALGVIPRPKGKPRKNTQSQSKEAQQEYEIKRLRMENKLLQDFLQLTEGK